MKLFTFLAPYSNFAINKLQVETRFVGEQYRLSVSNVGLPIAAFAVYSALLAPSTYLVLVLQDLDFEGDYG
jgi:hypothetical protein